jgi:hypothetical protein
VRARTPHTDVRLPQGRGQINVFAIRVQGGATKTKPTIIKDGGFCSDCSSPMGLGFTGFGWRTVW